MTKMAPNAEAHLTAIGETEPKKSEKFQTKIVWINAFLYAFLHLSLLYAIYLSFTSAHWKTTLFAYFYANLGQLGINAGSHRLWAHRSYKARLPLRMFLGILCSIAAQNTIFDWCRDHRVHHKYTETSADPHDIKRGFFFAHIGWLMRKKHPDVVKKGKALSVDDLLADPVIRFHRKFFVPLVLLFSVVIPAMIPTYFWGESVWNSFYVAVLGRYCLSLNITWLVNSAAHSYGNQPFDKYIEAKENASVSFFVLGEGWHNYHHAFPFDYSTSELGYTFNVTKLFIDFMAFIGQAYELKRAHPASIASKKEKSGDGTRRREINYSMEH